jgi:hypothetical protein
MVSADARTLGEEAVVAYGFQYVPRLGAGRSQRPIAERAAITSGAGSAVQVHDLSPVASTVAQAIEDVYRDIEALRAIVSEAPGEEDDAASGVVPRA